MISPITWLWNIRHRKLIEETRAIIRLHQFLRYDCGLREADRLSARQLKGLLGVVSVVVNSGIIKNQEQCKLEVKMNYYVDLFSPETAMAFEKSNKKMSGFRISRKTYIENQKISPGDRFICYVIRIQRFVGVLEIKSQHFVDQTPIFTNENDPFVLRFKVSPLVWLPLNKAIPIHEDFIWNSISFTKDLNKDSNRWTYMVFSSPRAWPREDCQQLEKYLIEQSQKMVDYPFDQEEEKKLKPQQLGRLYL